MSRLQTRISELERKLSRCHGCAERGVEVTLASPGQQVAEKRPRSCRECGEPVERLSVLLSFTAPPGPKRQR